MLDFLNQGWVGAVIGIIGILSGYWFYKVSTIGPRLVYQWSSLKIIGKNEKTPNEIEIFYKGFKVPRIIKTTIVVWNSGKSTIDGKNIVVHDPLRFEFGEEEEIIRASILRSSRDVNQLEIINDMEQKNILEFKFEFLDPKDGAIIEILHTDVNRYPEIKGSIKGIPKGPLYWGSKSRTRKGISKKGRVDIYTVVRIARSKWLKLLLLFMGIGMILFSLLPFISYDTALSIAKTEESVKSTFIQWSIMGILYIGLSIAYLWIGGWKRYPKMLDPERLENDFND